MPSGKAPAAIRGEPWWSDLRLAEHQSAGSKASQLGQLLRWGFRVPAGGVVCADVHRRRAAGELSNAEFTAWLRDRLLAAGCGPGQRFAVRSSAHAEDSQAASFAGLFLSELNVVRDSVPDAVTRVQESVASPAVAAYCRRLGMPVPRVLAVIVQEQVRPSMAGVCFTVDPVTCTPEVIVEYAHGLADAMIGGRQSPAGRARFQRGEAELSEAEIAGADPGLADVARAALRLETLLQGPQDVEWAIDSSGLWLLQSRPITTVPGNGPSATARPADLG